MMLELTALVRVKNLIVDNAFVMLHSLRLFAVVSGLQNNNIELLCRFGGKHEPHVWRVQCLSITGLSDRAEPKTAMVTSQTGTMVNPPVRCLGSQHSRRG